VGVKEIAHHSAMLLPMVSFVRSFLKPGDLISGPIPFYAWLHQ
jgi:hypothetical protein